MLLYSIRPYDTAVYDSHHFWTLTSDFAASNTHYTATVPDLQNHGGRMLITQSSDWPFLGLQLV